MFYYRLYFVNGGHIERAEEIHADGDEAARQVAESRIGPHALELWCERRKVAAFSPSSAATG